MREAEIHNGLMAWLKKNGLFYIHSTFGKKATMTKDAPDFIIAHTGRAILIEAKTEKGALTPGQKESFAKIQERSGMVVHIVRSVEQAVSVVETWLGVESEPSVPEAAKSDNATRISAVTDPFILRFQGQDAVFIGDPRPGGEVQRIRTATPADLINLPRR